MTGEPDSKPGRRPPTIELKATEVENRPSPEQPAAPENQAAPEDIGATQPGGDRTTVDERESQAAGDRATEQQASAPPGNGTGASRWKSGPVSAAMGAIVGAVAVAAIGAGLWLGDFIPSREAATPPAGTATPDATRPSASVPQSSATADISERLDKIERTIQAQRPEPTTISPALDNRLATAEARTNALADSVAALNRRVDEIAATSLSATKQADAATAAVDAARDAAQVAANDAAKVAAQNAAANANQSDVQRSDLDALANRIAALESTVKTLSDNETREPPTGDDRPARLTIAAEALRAAVERGVPYGDELTTVQALGVDRSATAPLEPFAATGLPSAATLGHELATLTPALDRSSDTASSDTASDDAGFLGRLKANAQKLVRITPVGAPVSEDPSAAVGRIAIDAAHADIAAALTDIAALPEAAKPLVADWVKKAQARDAALAASRQIAADALTALSKPAAQ